MRKMMIGMLVFLIGSAQVLAADDDVQELTPFKKIGVHRVFVSKSNNLVEKWPAVFPSGTKQLEVVLVLNHDPAYGVRLDTEITSESGKLDIKPQGAPGRFSLFGDFYLTQVIIPSSGSFADGAYTCAVKLNKEDIAKINWSIGNNKKQAE